MTIREKLNRVFLLIAESGLKAYWTMTFYAWNMYKESNAYLNFYIIKNRSPRPMQAGNCPLTNLFLRNNMDIYDNHYRIFTSFPFKT